MENLPPALHSTVVNALPFQRRVLKQLVAVLKKREKPVNDA